MVSVIAHTILYHNTDIAHTTHYLNTSSWWEPTDFLREKAAVEVTSQKWQSPKQT